MGEEERRETVWSVESAAGAVSCLRGGCRPRARPHQRDDAALSSPPTCHLSLVALTARRNQNMVLKVSSTARKGGLSCV